MCASGHEAASAHIVVTPFHRGEKLRDARGRMTEACVQLQDPLAPRGIGGLVPGKIGIDDAAVLWRPDVHYPLIDLRASFYNVTCPVLRYIVEDAIPAVVR